MAKPESKNIELEASGAGDLTAALLLEMNGFLNQKTVQALTTLSHSEIHRRQQAGTFPAKEAIGKGSRKGYRARIIQDWLNNPGGWKSA